MIGRILNDMISMSERQTHATVYVCRIDVQLHFLHLRDEIQYIRISSVDIQVSTEQKRETGRHEEKVATTKKLNILTVH